MNQLEIDRFYLREAYKYAGKYSQDPIAQNGAVIVRNNNIASLDNILAWGVNRLPEGYDKLPKELIENILNDKTKKLLHIRHAERDAIFSAVKKGVYLKGRIMYCSWITCHDCADAITGVELREVIGHTGPDKFYEEVNREAIEKGEKKSGWTESTKAGFERLDKAGVKYRFYDGEIGGVKIIFARHEFEP